MENAGHESVKTVDARASCAPGALRRVEYASRRVLLDGNFASHTLCYTREVGFSLEHLCLIFVWDSPTAPMNQYILLVPHCYALQGFYVSMRHCRPFCLGLNCALGATQMRPFLQRLAQVAECFVHVYSNAGLPNAMGGYDDTPEDMARDNLLFAEEGLINMLGGCCGSTPAHIKASQFCL